MKLIRNPYLLTWNAGSNSRSFNDRAAAERYAKELGKICALWIRTTNDQWEFVTNIG
jgi:hypothetical protein